MAYYTNFYLRAKPITDVQHSQIDLYLTKLRPGIEASDTQDGEGCWQNLEDTWYDYEQDMLDLSTQFPDVLFSVYCEGDDRDDIWTRYFKNGLTQLCPVYSLSWPLRPNGWTKMHKNDYGIFVDSNVPTVSERRVDTVLNAVYQCMAELMPACSGEWPWDTDLLSQSVLHMAKFMVQHGLSVELPQIQQLTLKPKFPQGDPAEKEDGHD